MTTRPPAWFHLTILAALVVGLATVASAVQPKSAKQAEAGFMFPSPMAPGVPTNVTVNATSSAGTTLTNKGGCVRITCTADCLFRVTAGSSTAVSTDNYLPGQTPERFCMLSSQDTVTFYNAGGSSLTANVAVAAGAP